MALFGFALVGSTLLVVASACVIVRRRASTSTLATVSGRFIDVQDDFLRQIGVTPRRKLMRRPASPCVHRFLR